MEADALRADRIKRTDAGKLQDEYAKLVAGLQEANESREEDDVMANPGTWFPGLASRLPATDTTSPQSSLMI